MERRGEERRGNERRSEERRRSVSEKGAGRGKGWVGMVLRDRVEHRTAEGERILQRRGPMWKQSSNTMLEGSPLPSSLPPPPLPFIILKAQTGCDALPSQIP